MIKTLIIFFAIVFLLAIIIFPEFRKKLKVLFGGFLNIFVEDVAKTPDGARAIYQQAIQEQQERYNKASDTLQKFSGKLRVAQNKLATKKEELKTCESKCEFAVKSGNMDSAKIFAEKRQEILDEIKRLETIVNELSPAVKEAQMITEQAENSLLKLKRESKTVVDGIELKQQLKESYDELDELKNVKTIDTLLSSVKDGYEDVSSKAAGAKVVHESKNSTKVAMAEQSVKSAVTDEYLQSLKNKYKK